ncbi:hypothetical protein QL285_009774 [Trifolium repens]|nr:hypothetical protein QL285_009774 [Trifolium repens]
MKVVDFCLSFPTQLAASQSDIPSSSYGLRNEKSHRHHLCFHVQPPSCSLHNLSSHCNLIPFLPVIFVFTTPLLPSPILNNKRSRINCAAMDNGGDANDVEMNGGNDMHNEEGEEELDVNRRATETLEDWLKAKATRLMNHRPVIQEAE